jgi:carboxyl-terminal processing protease
MLAALVVMAGGLWAFMGPGEKYFDIAKNLDIFATLFKEVNACYVDEVEPRKLINHGIEGMLESLDPYTDYIPEEDLESFSILTTGQYAGIGALIGVVNKKTVITETYAGFPAQRGGLQVGDEFISVDGQTVQGRPTAEVSALLKGQPQTDVTVEVKRFGKSENIKLKLKREKIKISNIVYQTVLPGQVGYLKLDDFTPGAGKEVEEAVVKLKAAGAKSLIIDLRDNPGGLLHEAVNIANLFLPKGVEVVSTRGKLEEWNKSYKTLNAPLDTELPLVMLTSRGTASAAEIVAGSLQDYDRAVLVGDRTFGKGLVQTTRPLTYNAQLKVTTAKYYIPSGRCVQALDYQHRQEDGEATTIPDSLRRAFRTKAGRTVYDGAGLEPEIKIESDLLGAAVTELAYSGYVFDYATRYVHTHPAPASLVGFKLSDEEYGKFVRWLQEQKFTYTTPLEKRAQELSEAAKRERFYPDLEASLKEINKRIEQSHQTSWTKFKPEVSALLEQQIAFHYKFHAGQAEVSLQADKELKAALDLLNNSQQYRKLLAPR